MRKKIIFLLLLIIPFMSVKAEEFNFTNENNVSLTQEEYNFIINMFYDGYQNIITETDYNNIFEDHEIVKASIEKNEIENYDFIRATYHETQSKKFAISKACTSDCLITLVANWKKNPTIRSYDVIGAYLDGTSLISTFAPTTSAVNTASSNHSNEIITTSNGFGVSVKLPTGGDGMTVSQYFKVSTGGTVYGSYQHATANISLANSKKYSISRTGYGGVFSFQNSVRDYYDAMNGVSISV